MCRARCYSARCGNQRGLVTFALIGDDVGRIDQLLHGGRHTLRCRDQTIRPPSGENESHINKNEGE